MWPDLSYPVLVGSRLSACWSIELNVEGDETGNLQGWCSGSSTRPAKANSARKGNKVSNDGAKSTYVCDCPQRLTYRLVDTRYRNDRAARQVVVSRGMRPLKLPTNKEEY